MANVPDDKQPVVLLKLVNPVIPADKEEKRELKEDLVQMRYKGLLERPWCIRGDFMVQELTLDQMSKWKDTVRAKPEVWTAVVWRKVYNFDREGEGLAF